MKKVTLASLALVVMLFFAPLLQAQWTTNTASTMDKKGLTLTFAGQLDTLGGTYASLTSDVFKLDGYLDNPDIDYSYLITHSGNVKIKVTLLKSKITNTAGSMGSTILQDSIKTKTEGGTYVTMSGNRSFYYRLKVESLATSRDNAVFKIILFVSKRN